MTKKNLKKYAKNDKEWHYLVCARENYVCEKCGHNFDYECYFDVWRVNEMVCGHHCKSKKAHPKLRLVVSNGKCVCKPCHQKIHN